MKVYLVYDGQDTSGNVVREMTEGQFKVKVDVPASWLEGPCERLRSFFVKTLTAKRKDVDVSPDDLIMKCGGIVLKATDVISRTVREYNDIYFLHKVAAATAASHEGETLCTNYGCGTYYKEEDNTDTSCHYHAKAPVFHDLEKHWACCPEKKAFDWESFQAIPPCLVGRHSTANKAFSFQSAEVTNAPLSMEQVGQQESPIGAAGQERKTTGPREFEGAMCGQAGPQEVVDGKAKCRNFGCGKLFVVDENEDGVCQFHKEGPVFWDTYKYWKCCPEKKCYEFDDFVKVPGCSRGPHKI